MIPHGKKNFIVLLKFFNFQGQQMHTNGHKQTKVDLVKALSKLSNKNDLPL